MSRRTGRPIRCVGAVVAGLVVLGACSATDPSSADVAAPPSATEPPTSTSTAVAASTVGGEAPTPTPTTTGATTTAASTTTTTSTSTTTTTTSTSTATVTTSTTVPPTTPAPTTAPVDGTAARARSDARSFPSDVEIEIGRSVEGRPITVIRRGTPGGTPVLAVGVIHGNEAAGVAIIDRLAVEAVPDGVELWLVRSMNPDGEAIDDRQNANAVDLNRNFPENWDVLGEPGFWQYGGTGPASEPETQAMVALGQAIRPEVLLWYHQDLYRIAPGTGRSGDIRRRYAEVSGLPVVEITGGTYTGTASQWSRTVIPERGVGITVELGPTLSEQEIVAHVAAVHAIAVEYF